MTADELEPQLATYAGFAARVEAAPGFWRNAGGGIGVLAILLFLGSLAQGHPRSGLYLLAAAAVPAVVLVLLGVRTERRTLRPLHAAYLARGRLAPQVPTGLVLDLGGDATTVRLDAGLSGGRRERWAPIVLVGAPGQPPGVLGPAAAATVQPLVGAAFEDRFEVTQRVRSELPPWGSGDAARVFAVPEGTLLAEQTGRSPFVVVISPDHRSHRVRPRLYAVRAPLSARSARRTRRAAAAAR